MSLSDRIQRARAALAAGFTSEAARKEVLSYDVGRAFEQDVHDAITGKMIAERDRTASEAAMAHYWDVPHSITSWRPKHAALLGKDFPAEVALAAELIALRDAIKGAALVPRAPTKTSIAKEKRGAVAKTCQICGRPILAETGVIAHHGYKRPGHGWQTASCYGARELPFEKSRDCLGRYIALLHRQSEQLTKMIEDTASERRPFQVLKTTYAKHHKKHTEMRDCTRETFEELKASGFDGLQLKTFEEALEWAVNRIRHDLQDNANYTKFQTARFDGWDNKTKEKAA